MHDVSFFLLGSVSIFATHIVRVHLNMIEKCDLSNLAFILLEKLIETQNQINKNHIARCRFELPANEHGRFGPL